MARFTCGPGQAASRLLLGFDDALRAQKRGADGSDHSARTDRSPASVAAAFYRRGKMVGREGSREGAGIGAAGAGTPRADRSVVFRTEPATNQNFTRYFEVICWPTIGLRAASDGAAEVITALAGRRTHSKTRVPRAQNAFTRGADDL